MNIWQHLLFNSSPSKQRVVGSNPPRDATRSKSKHKPASSSNDKYEKQVLDALTLENTIKFYINALYAEKKSPKTIEAYQSNLTNLISHIGDMKLQDINSLHIRDFQAQRAIGRSSYTVHQSFRVLRSFFNWCIREGFIEINPLINVHAPRLDSKVIQTYRLEEVQLLLSVCPPKKFLGARNKAIISVLMDTGMRESELVDLDINNVDFKTGIMKIRGKGNKERIVHVSYKARQAIWKYTILRDIKTPRTEAHLFLSEEMRPLTPDGLRTIIRKLGLLVGLKRCGVHKFRHTFAIEFLRNGGNLPILRQILGHANISTTMKYLTALNADDLVNSHQRFSPGDKFL